MDNTLPMPQSQPQGSVQIQLDHSDFSAAPGNRIEIPYRLISRRDQIDYFEVTVRGIPVGWVFVPNPVVQIGPNEQKEGSLYILPPAEDGGIVGVYPFYIQVSSQSSPELSAEVTVNLRVGGFEHKGRIDVLMDVTQYSVTPGSTVFVPLALYNRGIVEDNLVMEVDGIPPNWVSTNSPIIHLRPGESRQVNLAITPPRTPSSKVGRNPFTILVSSQTDASQVVRLSGTLTIGAFSQFASDLSPHRLEKDQPARLRILNQGNIQDTYHVEWQSQENALEFLTAQVMPVRAQPGETVAVDFDVERRSRHWIGGLELFPFVATVRSAEGESQPHSGEYISRGFIPVWVLPVLLLACLGLVCAGGLLWNRMSAGTTGAALTVTAQTALAVTQTAQVAAATQTAVYNMTAAALVGQTDSDGDGLSNDQEQLLGTNPNQADSDTDRLPDGEEVRLGLNPLNPETDGDGIIDGLDLDPLDVNNPRLTATALAALPTAAPTLTGTPVPATATLTPPPAATATFTPPPPSPTVELSPSPQAMQIPPDAVLAFVSDRAGSLDIQLLAPSNGSLASLAASPAADSQPAWSPSGEWVAFVSDRDGNNEIYVVKIDGSGLANLTNNPANDQYPVWSPDGNSIAFTSDRDGNNEIYRMGVDGSNPLNLTNHPAQDEHPSWYQEGGLIPGADRIVFATNRDGNFEIYRIDSNGANPINLTNHAASDSMPSASRTGGKLAFVTDRDGNNEIYSMGIDGSGLANRSSHPANDSYPAWSNNGSWLAFTSDREGNQEIYLIASDGAAVANLTNNAAQDVYPSWRSP